MSKHFENYLDILSHTSPDAVGAIKKTTETIVAAHIVPFSHKEHVKGLLLGQVQSGKTGQMFGIVAATADTDEAFTIFILLTSDMSSLQQQTYKRALAAMDTFNVCDEHDEMRFLEIGQRKPSLIILKKNSKILKKWRGVLGSAQFSKGRPIFIVDDEADAASLNTQVNKSEQSAINKHLQAICQMFTSSFYLQVTATPQSLLLQTANSGWRPAFKHYFLPGKKYLGGEFFYSKPKPFTNKTTADDELSILLEEEGIAAGLKKAIETFLITSSHLALVEEGQVCNFLVHPSSRINDHEKIKQKVISYLDHVFNEIKTEPVKERLRIAWEDLRGSKPDLKSFQSIVSFLSLKPEISVYTMNSAPSSDSRLTFDHGFNIIIGGNSLGRGVTFKSLQTVYYCRSSKSPQADTFWQHCRMFGYDRDPLLMRVFMPEALFNLFSEINASNEVLLKQVQENRFDDIDIVTSGKVRPTRKSVIDQSKYDFIVGGVNYFPPRPDQDNAKSIDGMLKGYPDGMHDLTVAEVVKILKAFSSDPQNSWSISAFSNALRAIGAQKDFPDIVKVLIRRDRNISKGTGTLLSQADRASGDQMINFPVLTLYRLSGKIENGWEGRPFWIPNIKMPYGKVFHRVEG